jgi:hypothetical protein
MSTPVPFDPDKRKRERDEERRRQHPDSQPGKPDPSRDTPDETEEEWSRTPPR